METSTVLLGVRSAELGAWVQELAQVAISEQKANTLRPQVGSLIPHRPAHNELPLYARPSGHEIHCLYAVPPQQNAPFGLAVCAISAKFDSGGPIPVHIWCAPTFPLISCEVRWLLEQKFPHQPEDWLPVPQTLRTVGFGEFGRQLLGVVEEPEPSRQKHTEHHGSGSCRREQRPGGAPLLACTEWLIQQMRLLPDPAACTHLYDEWLERYTAIRQNPPADPKRSFRLARTIGLKRLRQHGEHRRPQDPPSSTS